MLKDSYDFKSVMLAVSRINTNLSPDIVNVKYLFSEFQDDMTVLSSFFADLKDRYGEFPWKDRSKATISIIDSGGVTADPRLNTSIYTVPCTASISSDHSTRLEVHS